MGDMLLKPGEAWEYCPREALRRVSRILKDEFNLVCLTIYNLPCKIPYLMSKHATCSGNECRL